MKSAKRKTKVRPFWVAWDCEARNWTELVAVCAVGEDGRVVRARTFEELFEEASKYGWCTPRVVWWSHYGGKYDHRMLLDYLDPTKWRIGKMHCDARGLWSMVLERGEWVVRLADSFALLPVSLEKLGRIFGERKKTEVDRAHIESYSEDEIFDYCVQDCRVLLTSLLGFERLWSWGPVRRSLAGTSTMGARIRCVPRGAWGWRPTWERTAELGYYGGRCEVFVRQLGAGRGYDLRSAYPWAMTLPLPTRCLGIGDWQEGRLAIVNARVRVESDYPLLPVRVREGSLKGKLVFPVGEFDGWWTSEELKAGVEAGEVRIVKVYRALNFDSEPWLEPYIRELFELRRSSKDEALKFVAKIALNSISGKFVEDPENRWYQSGNGGIEVRTRSGVWRLVEKLEREYGAFRHAACGALVTARARIRLWEAYRELQRQGARIAYSDTDSVWTDGVLETGPELGDWDLANEFDRAEFLLPKVYACWKDGEFRAKSKGVRIRSEEQWEAMKRGEPIEREAFVGPGMGLRRGDLTMERQLFQRVLTFGRLDKRCFRPDGSSRPWAYSELASL